MATKKFNCDICNYHSSKPYDWINHCNTAKHKNKGAKNQEIALYAIILDQHIGT
jgi:hypothetical protein